jgi:hypothetical protein
VHILYKALIAAVEATSSTFVVLETLSFNDRDDDDDDDDDDEEEDDGIDNC